MPAELRRALFQRFRVAMIDVEPAHSHVLTTMRYIPRIQAERSAPPSELVTAVATSAARARRGLATADDARRKRLVLQGWSRGPPAGDHKRAAGYFAPGAVVEHSSELLLTSPRAALAYNRDLPVPGPARGGPPSRRISTLAAFRLAGPSRSAVPERRAHARAVGDPGGKFEEWRQLDEPTQTRGATAAGERIATRRRSVERLTASTSAATAAEAAPRQPGGSGSPPPPEGSSPQLGVTR